MNTKVKAILHTTYMRMFIHNAGHRSIEPQAVELKIPRREAEVATTLWNMSSSIRLNEYQRKAVELALSNKFVMIQGPPGMEYM